jgi:hypothetical protein
MSTTGEAVEKYVKEYRAADKVTREGKRNIALFEFFKWELIKDELIKIDEEEAIRMESWKKLGIEHLERPGCIINIREHLADEEGNEVTSIEILPDDGWTLEGYVNNRLIKRRL